MSQDASVPNGSAAVAVHRMADHIEALTGYRPPTCPWRAMYDPLVGEVVGIATLGAHNFGESALGDDPPAILLDALRVYLRAREGTKAHDAKEEAKKKR